MRNFILLFFILIIFGVSSHAQTNNKSLRGRLPADISKMTGGDSMDLLNDPVIKMRLKKLLGKKNYDSFLESFETVTPVERKGSFLFSSGCIIHGCLHAESAVAIDLVNKTVHAAIFRQDEKTKYFNENRRRTPKLIRNWANRLAANYKNP